MSLRDRRLLAGIPVVAMLVFGVAACGDDDGSGVRESGETGSSGSGSGASGSGASGSGASGSETGSGAEAACVEVGDPAAAENTIGATLDEFSITLDESSAAPGTIAFEAVNDGEEPHEIVVAAFEGDPATLPTKNDGSVDEEQLPAGSVIGEIEGFPAGEVCAGAFELAAGDYALFCNIVEEEDGETEAHFEEGMHTSFTVGG